MDFFESRHHCDESVTPLEIPKELEPVVEGCFNTVQLFDDVRHAIDAIHSDGSLKSIIARHMDTYIENSPNLALTLHKLRSTGKKLFLLTNSHWEYTNQVLGYLLDGKLPQYSTWRAYFEVVVVDSKKPHFFFEQHPFVELEITEDGKEVPKTKPVDHLERAKTYSQGNIKDFEHFVGATGEEILYVGDHIYGDIVSSKKETLLRTCLVVEELTSEILLSIEYAREIDQLAAMAAHRLDVDTQIGYHRALLAHVDAAIIKATQQQAQPSMGQLTHNARVIRKEIDSGKKFIAQLDEMVFQQFESLENRYHPIWGRLTRQHDDLSRFGQQVSSYACIYTSHLTNLLQYSPMHFFKSPSELMSHDQVLTKSSHIRKARSGM